MLNKIKKEIIDIMNQRNKQLQNAKITNNNMLSDFLEGNIKGLEKSLEIINKMEVEK